MTKAIELSQLGSNLDVGTEIELSKSLRTSAATYGNNVDAAYLIVGTPGYTGATTNWNTFGLQHRFKSNGGGVPRITVDSKNGELFCIEHDGKVGIGTTDPFSELDVHSSAFADITISSERIVGNIGGFNFRKNTGGTPTSVAQMFVTVGGDYNFRAGGNASSDHAFSIKADGNVGVGTDNPATKFAVHGVTSIGNNTPSTGAGNFNVKPHDGQDSYLKIRPASDFVSSVVGSAIDLRDAANASSKELIVRADRYRLWTSNEKITVTNSGLVGINETNPGHYIDMNIGTTNIGMKMTSTDAGSYIQFADNSTSGETKIGAEGDNFVFDVNGNDNSVLIKGDGNVGIGTDNPGAKLHIQGLSRQIGGAFSDNITYGGRTFTAHHDIQATSMRGGILVRNMNNFRSETDSASFMHYDGYTTSVKSYAFRVARGTTLSDTFWVKSDGSMYTASTFTGTSIGLTSNITQTANAPQHIFRETGTTHGTTAWALVRDGDSFSIRWNNAAPYALRAATSGGSVSSIFLRQNGLEVNASGTVIQGSLSKGSGSFRIQHPLAELSETTDLVHSFVEAPDASNLYAGMVQLTDGVAVVNIDTAHRMTEGTFVALNHVQSWSSSNESGYAPVKCSISGNLLTIECQDTNSTDTVYYEVRGIRKDQHMIDTDWTDNEGRVITEPPKRVVPE